ncbi:hypothetical protein ACH5RR_021917 [Cinchona calisaya]|uniref:Dirigent protein n=1 Tax=Cinchona calisaya TaxID=153742 RepID=A0ABD2Z6D8_9GENT
MTLLYRETPIVGGSGEFRLAHGAVTTQTLAGTNTKLVGRARGIYGSAGQTDACLIMLLSYGFVDGIYNSSSFSLLSINQAMNPVREMSIVGGTGLFRLARGYAIAQTYSFELTTGDAIVGYNVTLATYI